MVDRQELMKYWKQRPFQPFRIYLANGDVYVIRYPELLMVCPTYLVIGIPVPNHPLLLCDRVDRPSYEEMVRLEPLPSTATAVPS
jgi:hypothetical protein